MRNLLLLVFFIFNSFVYSQTATPPLGAGTINDPYLVGTINNLFWITQNSSAWDKVYKQTADIDASTSSSWDGGAGFYPIGDSITQFSGIYDGQTFTIKGVSINRIAQNHIGFFGYTMCATIKNVNLDSVNIFGNLFVGGLIGEQACYVGSVTNCSSSGSVTGSDHVGGLIGQQYGSAIAVNCHTGGIVTGGNIVGGLVGMQFSGCNTTNCFSSASVTGSTVGGLIGAQYGGSTAINCYSTGLVTGGSPAGGLIGSQNGSCTASGCYSTSIVAGSSAVGGLIGGQHYTSIVTNCYSTGSVTGTSSVGGLIGSQYIGDTAKYSYSIGSVTGTSSVGGLIGYKYSEDSTVNSFWDTQSSGMNGSEGGLPKNTTEMKAAATFLNAGWDANIWNLGDGINNGYPYLSWQNSIGTPLFDIAAGLVAHYPFNGNANDESGNGNNGTVNGATLSTDRFGNAGKAYNFDGTQYISVPDNSSLNILGDLTISTWLNVLNPPQFRTNYGIVVKQSASNNSPYSLFINWQYGIPTDYQKLLFVSVTNNNYQFIQPPNDVNISSWTHAVCVIKNDSIKMYLNNVLVLRAYINNSLRASSNTPLLIGSGSGKFEGKIDDIRIYNRALSDAEIQALYSEGEVVDTTSLWKMQVKASISSNQDDENFVGVSDNATDGHDVSFDTAEPPPIPGNYISLYFPHEEWNSILGNNYASDIKKNTALADTVKRWYFQVKSHILTDTVILRFINDRIPASFGKYLTDLKTGKRVDLKNISDYKYFNTSDTARSFMLTIGDSTSPALSLAAPNGSNIWRSGTSKNILWNTSDRTGIDSVWIYYSSNAGTSYSILASLGNVQGKSWTVPAEYLNHNYSIKIIARDSLGNQSNVKSAKTFTIVGDSLTSSSSAGWSLISTPLTPKDSSLSSIFDNTSYLWSYAQSAGYIKPSKITLGTGYWLGLSTNKNWNIKGIANETDSSIQNLQLGYNIIGNNFVRNVSKNNLFFIKSGSYYNFTSAIGAGLISNALYGYLSSGYSSVDTMSLFSGYWIGVLQSGVQMIQKPNVSNDTPLAKQAKIFASNWELPINVSTATLADNIALIGIKQRTSSGFDAEYDAPRPPRNPGNNYLELYFSNVGGNYPSVLGSKYARDFRDSSSANWNFTIESSQNTDVTLSWDKAILEGLAGSVQLNLRDNSSNSIIDMRQVGNYTFTYSTPRLFSINAKITSVGMNKENLPTEYSLSQNYPNPFNPTTTLRFGLPERSFVKLTIYNSIGQLVSQIYSGIKDVGYFEYSFDASRLSSGIYLYKIQAVSEQNPNRIFVNSRKMILMK